MVIAITINRAIPALRADDAKPLVAIAIGYACCVTAAGLLQNMFIRLSVGVGQSVITELRMRLFTHLQTQSLAFHDEQNTYTKIVLKPGEDTQRFAA